jgi:hypothetical protein
LRRNFEEFAGGIGQVENDSQGREGIAFKLSRRSTF